MHPERPTIRAGWTDLINKITSDLNINWRVVSPNMVTASGIGLGVLSGYEVSKGKFFPALFLLGASSLADGLDGYIARRLGNSFSFGEFFDSVGDRVVDYALFTGMEHYTKSQSWSETQKLAQAARSLSLAVPYSRALAEQNGVNVAEYNLASRLSRLLTVAASFAVPKRKFWNISLSYLAGASVYTTYERLRHLYLQDLPEDIDDSQKKRALSIFYALLAVRGIAQALKADTKLTDAALVVGYATTKARNSFKSGK